MEVMTSGCESSSLSLSVCFIFCLFIFCVFCLSTSKSCVSLGPSIGRLPLFLIRLPSLFLVFVRLFYFLHLINHLALNSRRFSGMLSRFVVFPVSSFSINSTLCLRTTLCHQSHCRPLQCIQVH